MDKLKKKNIFTQIHYLPISKQPLFNNNNKKFLKSDKYFQKVLSIPIHDGIKLKDIKFISKTIDNELRKINER